LRIFNGLGDDFDKKVDFYHHEQHWANRMILGGFAFGHDQPRGEGGTAGQGADHLFRSAYGIKFGSNWQVSTRKRDVKDGKAEDATRQPEQIRAFRDTWRLGIHSYLAYLRDRLTVARELLTDTGSIFVQIGDENVHLVRCVMDEVFGSENFISIISFRKKTMPLGAKYLEGIGDFIIWYSKDYEITKFYNIFTEKSVEGDSHWNSIELSDGQRRKMTSEEISSHKLIPEKAVIYQLISLYPAGMNNSGLFPVTIDGKQYYPPHWEKLVNK
jgi:adenine-specific DNA-methyltransferase